jgi:uncharacterized membrane protein
MTALSHVLKNNFHQFFNAGLIIVFIMILSSSICYGQSGITWLKDPTGQYYCENVFGVSGDGKTVLVSLHSTVGYERVPAIWDSANGFQFLGFPAQSNVTPAAISYDGSVVVGHHDMSDPVSQTVGFRWRKNFGIQYLPSLPNTDTEPFSEAYCVSGDGAVPGGMSVAGDGFGSAAKWVGGEALNLNPFDNGYSECHALSYNGSVAVVYAIDQSGVQSLVKWQGSATVLMSGARQYIPISVTDNGDTVVGYCNLFAYRWTPSSVDTLMLYRVQAVSGDAKRILSYGYICDSGKTTSVSLKEECENNYGIDLQGYTISSTPGISADGSVVVGKMSNGSVFRMVLKPIITVIMPKNSKNLIGGALDTIKWRASRSVDSVDLYYSLDSGKTRMLIQKGYAMRARVDSIFWRVPDTVSQDCKVIIMASNDTTIRGESPIFTIRGYRLLRTNPVTSRYELFDISQHGWQFSNTAIIMWPVSWWGGFIYPYGQDPYTHTVYPDRDPFKHAKASDFIDWPLFVRTMGEQNCYYFFAGNSTTIYRGAAESFWESQKEKWGGSCYGFAISTLMAFGMPVEFRNTFPEMPAFNDPPNRYLLSGIADTDSARMVINSLYFSQNGKQHKTYFQSKLKSTTPKQTLAELREMLMSDVRDDKSLSLMPQNADGGHEIVAYRVTNDPPGSSKFQLYVDDSNIPTNKDAFVEIDTASDTWTYSHLKNSSGAAWGGSKGLTLDDPVSLYTQLPILPKGISSLPTRYKSVFLAEDSTWDVYLPSQTDVMITDNEGRSLGVVGDTVKWEIPDAVPMKPGTITSAPSGYTLPKGEYSVTVGPFWDTTAVVKLFTDAMIYAYRRYGVDSLQVDRFHLGSDGLMVKNTDASEKEFDLEAIIPRQNDSGEYRILLSGLTTGSGDSVSFAIDLLSIPVIRNYGSHPTAYDITLLGYQYMEGVGYDQQKFLHQSVIIDPNSTHTIRPVWNDLNHKSLEINIDLGNDGTIDSTSNIADQTLGVGGNGPNEVPQWYGLMQNYPNPFNPSTDIGFQLPEAANVRIVVYNVLGQQVAVIASGNYSAGIHHVSFDGSNLSGGVYLYRIEAVPVVDPAHPFVSMKKMVLVK